MYADAVARRVVSRAVGVGILLGMACNFEFSEKKALGIVFGLSDASIAVFPDTTVLQK